VTIVVADRPAKGDRKMKRRQFLTAVGTGAALAAIAKPAIAQSMPTIRWRLTASWPKSLDTIYTACESISRFVSEATDGKFQIKTFAVGGQMRTLAVIGLSAILAAGAGLSPSNAGGDDAKYPDWKGAWARWFPPGSTIDFDSVFSAGGQASFDQTKPWGFAQQAPLTPEYQKVLEDSIADQTKGGAGNYFDHGVRCLPGGMPQMMVAFTPLEFVVTPETTYILIGNNEHYRRIFTDGRGWPNDIEPTYAGYSIGRWIDTDGDGTHDTLEIETRGPFKGTRVYDATGLPLHFDNQSIIKERMYRDKVDLNILHDEITVIDHALTRPWTVDKKYVHERNPRPNWPEFYCTENNSMIAIGRENYFLSADGLLMPVRKDQPPPDLRYFKQTPK
jgi:hypothetical protein